MLVLKIIDKKFVLVFVHNKAPNVSTYKGLFFCFYTDNFVSLSP